MIEEGAACERRGEVIVVAARDEAGQIRVWRLQVARDENLDSRFEERIEAGSFV